jgi:hypothetical protein
MTSVPTHPSTCLPLYPPTISTDHGALSLRPAKNDILTSFQQYWLGAELDRDLQNPSHPAQPAQTTPSPKTNPSDPTAHDRRKNQGNTSQSV